jgi:CRP-like cAMP-binding protein
VTAVRDCEICFLTREDVHGLYGSYPELRARMSRFAGSGRILDDKALRALDLSRPA